jgi:hypothetical protein
MSNAANVDLQNMLSRDGKIGESYNDLEKPERHTIDLLSDDLPTQASPINGLDADFATLDSAVGVPKPGAMPQTAERALPAPPVQPEPPQTAEDIERDEIAAELVEERLVQRRAARVSAQVADAFCLKHPEVKQNPINAQLIAEALNYAGLPLSLENMEHALEGVRSMLDPRTPDQFSPAEANEILRNVHFPPPDPALLKAAGPATPPQPRQPQQSHPPCGQCGAAYEAHVNGECPAPARPNSWSTGMPERSGPAPQPELDVNNPADLRRLADDLQSLPVEQARAKMVALMSRARQGR